MGQRTALWRATPRSEHRAWARRIGATMDTATKRTRLLATAGERHTRTVRKCAHDPGGGHDTALQETWHLLLTASEMVGGRTPLTALAHCRRTDGRDEPMFTYEEIERSRTQSEQVQTATAGLPPQPGGADNNGDIGTACEYERRGWMPTGMMHHDDTWHIAGTTVFDENAHWGAPADDEPDGDERHEQGHVRAPGGAVPYEKDWDGVERAALRACTPTASLSRASLRRSRGGPDCAPFSAGGGSGCCGVVPRSERILLLN